MQHQTIEKVCTIQLTLLKKVYTTKTTEMVSRRMIETMLIFNSDRI